MSLPAHLRGMLPAFSFVLANLCSPVVAGMLQFRCKIPLMSVSFCDFSLSFQNQSLPKCLLKKLLAVPFLALHLLCEMEDRLPFADTCCHILQGLRSVADLALGHLITGLLWLWHCNYPYKLLKLMVKVKMYTIFCTLKSCSH